MASTQCYAANHLTPGAKWAAPVLYTHFCDGLEYHPTTPYESKPGKMKKKCPAIPMESRQQMGF